MSLAAVNMVLPDILISSAGIHAGWLLCQHRLLGRGVQRDGDPTKPTFD